MLFSVLHAYIQNATNSFDAIPEERKKILLRVSNFVSDKLKSGKKVELIYICTHNSRRSHLGQIWAETAVNYYGLKNVFAFSGGTEATAFNPHAIEAVQTAGFKVTKVTEGINPNYKITFSDHRPAILCFSKTYNDKANPKEDFCAIMTCSEADDNCPFIPGAELRISCPYDDPKLYDGMPEQGKEYNERCKQIATESLYLFSNVKKIGKRLQL